MENGIAPILTDLFCSALHVRREWLENGIEPMFEEGCDVTVIKEYKMGRKKKLPEHNPEQLMNELLTNLIQVWTSEKEPELKRIAKELEISPAKVRKLLIIML